MNIVNDQFTQFIPNADPECPRYFQVSFALRNGSKISFDAISCLFMQGSQCFEIMTTDEEIKLIPKDVVALVTYDNRFIRIKELEKKFKDAETAKKKDENFPK